jgi:hypothetical protein
LVSDILYGLFYHFVDCFTSPCVVNGKISFNKYVDLCLSAKDLETKLDLAFNGVFNDQPFEVELDNRPIDQLMHNNLTVDAIVSAPTDNVPYKDSRQLNVFFCAPFDERLTSRDVGSYEFHRADSSDSSLEDLESDDDSDDSEYDPSSRVTSSSGSLVAVPLNRIPHFLLCSTSGGWTFVQVLPFLSGTLHEAKKGRYAWQVGVFGP